MVLWVKMPLRTLVSHTGVLVQVPAHVPVTGVEDGCSAWVPVTHRETPMELSSWLWPSLDLAVRAPWGVTQRMIYLVLILTLSFQII